MDRAPPVIEYPCPWPISVVGAAAGDFRDLVETIVARHAPDFERESSRVQLSGGGRFMSVRITIRATGPEQLQALFEELKGSGRVHMVL